MKKNTNLNDKYIIVGDIGNTDVKICILKHNYLIEKKIIIKNYLIKKNYLEKKLKNIIKYKNKIDKILFSQCCT